MAWFRIDNRLIHGQIIETWLPYLDASHLVVVNDAVAADAIRQQIMELAIPSRITVFFAFVNQARVLHDHLEMEGTRTMYLFADCMDAVRLAEEGVCIATLNVGNLHYEPGKKALCAHVAVSEQDLQCLGRMRQQGVKMDFRSIPGDTPLVEDW